jgi:hypothetical protein
MKIFSNDKLIKRNGLIGNILSLLSIAILGVGMFVSFKDTDGKYLPLTFAALIIGFLLFQVGNYFMNRWGKKPRPDERISQALKGLDSSYSLYHYTTPVSHLLIGPAGIFCILPYSQPGIISYDSVKNKWKQSGGNFFLKTFGGESLGRPDLDAKYAISDAVNFIQKKGIELNDYIPQTIAVFTNPKAVLQTENTPIPAITEEKLKEFIRKQGKSVAISPDLIKKIQESIGN